MNYYNEINPYAAQWLRNLIAAGQIPDGFVDERSIEDVRPDELTGFTQCHFFAGIGGWPLALRLAGWPDSRPAWTGSCPCQPFSAAGKGAGFDDERHLWPSWQHLIAQCRPAIIFGEQVASKAVNPWIDLVHADLEGMGYAFGGIAFPAAGIGAPHIRDRTYWVGHSGQLGLPQPWQLGQSSDSAPRSDREVDRAIHDGGSVRLADTNGRNASAEREQCGGEQRQQPQDGGSGGLADAASSGRREECAHGGRLHAGDRAQGVAARLEHGGGDCRPGPTNGQWADADWLGCTDGKWRPVEPGSFPLAHGIPSRVGRLRAYGNAIVPAQAAEFITAYVEVRGLMPAVLEQAA